MRFLLRRFRNLFEINLLRRRDLDTEILAFLAQPEYLANGAYGLTIAEAVDITTGALYPRLARLQRQRFITSWWVEASPSRQRYYQLTGVGQAELLRRQNQASQPSPAKEEPNAGWTGAPGPEYS